MGISIDEIDEAWRNFKHDLVCERSDAEWVRYSGWPANLEYSQNGGESWSSLPWRMKFFSRILCRLTKQDWPPNIDCFGWLNGRVAIAWHDTSTDSEMAIGKYLAFFDTDEDAWKVKLLGFYNLEDGVAQTWFEHIGFDVLNRMRPLLTL